MILTDSESGHHGVHGLVKWIGSIYKSEMIKDTKIGEKVQMIIEHMILTDPHSNLNA